MVMKKDKPKKTLKKTAKKLNSTTANPGKGKNRAKRFKFYNEEGEEITMDTISVDNKRTITVQPVDAKGRPAPIDGVPVWTVSPEGGVSLFPSPDGLSCDVVWMGGPMTQTIAVTGDADLGAGVKNIVDFVDIETLASEATGFNISVGAEEPV